MKIKTNGWLFASQKSSNQQSIWLKEKKPLKQSDLMNLQVTPSYFQKRTKTFKRLVKRYYYIANNTLYYCEKQKSTSIKGMLDLSLVYAEFYESKVKILKNNTYIICLRQDSSFVELLTENKQIFNEWCVVLRRCCIMLDFHNQFNILKMIGKGGFSRVFLAQDKFSRENYAIKVITKDKLLQQTKGIKSLLNEIQIMKELDNVNGCLKLIGVYETDSSVNLILEYIKGGELVKKIKLKDKQNFTIENMRQLMQNILIALAHIHQRKIIHRDLKPDNILIEDDINSTKIKIADFGLATYDSTVLNDFLFKKCGTPGFLAPEVLSNKDTHKLYDHKVDVFSAGVIFYILLCGQQPFKGSNHRQVVEQNKKCEIDFQILDSNQKIPQAAKILVKQMLAKDPINRPTSQECLNSPFFKENIINNSLHFDLHNYENQKLQSLDGLNRLKIDSLDKNSQNDLYWVNPVWKGQTNTVQTVTKLSSIYLQINDVRKRNKSNFAPINVHAEESKDDDSGIASSVREKRSASADCDFRNKYLQNQSLHITVLKKQKQGDEQTNNDNPEASIDNNIDCIEENFDVSGYDLKNSLDQQEQNKNEDQFKQQNSDYNNNQLNLKASQFKKSQFLDSNRDEYKPSMKSSGWESIENEPQINKQGLNQNRLENKYSLKPFQNMEAINVQYPTFMSQISQKERQDVRLSNIISDEKVNMDEDFYNKQYSSNRSIEYNLKKNEALENHCQKVNHIKIKLRDFNSSSMWYNPIQQIVAAPSILSKENQNYNSEAFEDEQHQYYSRQGIRNSTYNQNSCQEADFRVSEVEENISSRHFTTINRNLIFRYNPFDCNVCL
ncbi:Serine/Threonine kinase domain protein (macronuclear) [Tetrahymena thermophila SB210]|uniref:Serine/Threonine kinase domain protein n=1 Tax=Tetrahymena thermophila (strain SB210) TaxID=312017 RepID=Q22XZ7_TETTS|nr:Serine/Threonine kinase domain protein [Tetrahymena thermophila SB210]EAR90227.3 Serine/Threonine kinase domain protein [Tetrahymena thermophila SB210]|eukprot:XP_001010472.3 Serine/Threonine kinase domain protein [Tetrahymena thermophila SB210]